MTEYTSHEYLRNKALNELAKLVIPVTKDEPTTIDVPLSIKWNAVV